MRNDGLIKTYIADGAIAINRFVKFGSADNKCAQASAVSDKIIGVSADVAADAAGDPVDVIMDGIAHVTYGGSITRGDPVTTDANGKAVAAADSINKAIIDGGAAGNHTVTGIKTTDTLVAVLQIDVASDTGTSASGDKVQAIADLTSEFTISAANTINNTGGSATTGDKLLVLYRRKDTVVGTAMVSGVSGDRGSVHLK